MVFTEFDKSLDNVRVPNIFFYLISCPFEQIRRKALTLRMAKRILVPAKEVNLLLMCTVLTPVQQLVPTVSEETNVGIAALPSLPPLSDSRLNFPCIDLNPKYIRSLALVSRGTQHRETHHS